MIEMANVFYQVVQVATGDATGATVKYQATAIPSDKVPAIRALL